MMEFVSAGHFISEGEWIHPRRCIDSYEILCVLKGQVFLCEEEMQYALEENEILLLEPGKIHFGTQKSSGVEFYWIHFRTDEPPRFKHFLSRESYEIKAQVKRLLHITNTPDYPASSLGAAIQLLVGELNFQAQHPGAYSGRELSARICEYVRIHASMPMTVEGIAGHFGYSPGYISKFFRAQYGVGLKQYIESERMKYAKSVLITTDRPVKEIAGQMGFSEMKNFIKFFSYHEKISPTRYRNLYFHTHQNNR